jgi:hypothetical protein
MTSIVGTWHILITWTFGAGVGTGTELNFGNPTFEADGTWVSELPHRGRWLQVGDQVIWNTEDDVVYSGKIEQDPVVANVSTITGIMGLLIHNGKQGTFRGGRVSDPVVGPVAGTPPDH